MTIAGASSHAESGPQAGSKAKTHFTPAGRNEFKNAVMSVAMFADRKRRQGHTSAYRRRKSLMANLRTRSKAVYLESRKKTSACRRADQLWATDRAIA